MLVDILATAPTQNIQTMFTRMYGKIHGYDENPLFKNIMVSVSGGSDSDVMLDAIERVKYPHSKLTYVFFDTGIEFKATIEHLDFLEEKYGIKIQRVKAVIPSVVGVRKYGIPFLSKQISNYIQRLQKHGFKWEDDSFEVLYARYPKCKAALRWWCNEWGENSKLNISNRRYLREFMHENPPDFLISDKCCECAKKRTAHKVEKELKPDLAIVGVRKAEGGARSTAYTSCFTEALDGEIAQFRPIFWLLNEDKAQYENAFEVQHSDCYTKYGLHRTGCACCPFGRDFEKELKAAKEYEPNLYKLAISLFGKSYEYTRKYLEYVQGHKAKENDHGRCCD